ncbi:dienelactone hydrolase family protein [Fulvivirga kasyanovii]|uniref:Alpha/beta hydrolase n=1 Tax=Fulvivirga kasyanovii TaxID=396812 RepID=A0ABW9RWM9_9BACT|nr:dienelactone hydrolase family protein [Fulvivirga kasyanovii]MTI28607.1 alpha/beta hydrolase [Fulvivirga kasyanovii]
MKTIKKDIQIDIEGIMLEGNLVIPDNPAGLVLFSHGSGSSRFSPRNNYVAEQLQQNHMATLLFDLLTKYEDAVYENRFDVDLLTDRLLAVTHWARQQNNLKGLPIGYFGASTGAASALKAAAKLKEPVSAIVSRGGRPDLAIPLVAKVKAPTLLIVGSKDTQVITLNKQAYEQLAGEKEMKIIEGASHLFEEPGKLEQVAKLAGLWFSQHLSPDMVGHNHTGTASEH